MQGYPPPPGGGAPPGGYVPPPGGGVPPGGYGPPPGGGAPPGGYGPPPGGFGAPPGGFAPPMGMAPGAGMMNQAAPFGIEPTTGLPYSDKQKMTAGLIQIFLGSFGVGRFYTGHTGLAIAQIAAVWLTCGLGAVWPLIDGIMMLTGKVTDAQGRPLRD